MPRHTRDEVARLAGVSTATVSRVMSQTGAPVSEELRERVLTIADQLNYRPNFAARALVTGKTRLIALWAQDCYTPYYSLLGRLIAQQGIRRHYQIVSNSRLHIANVPNPANLAASWQVDGLLLCDISSQDRSVRPLYKADIPRVNLGVFHPNAEDYVETDLYQGTMQALAHLLRPGCKRIAYMHNREATYARDPRTRAYDQMMREAGLENAYISLPDQKRQTAREAIKDHARARGLPDAVFCINDDVAIGCYRGLLDLGVHIPEDVALMGCDGLPDLEYLDMPISTIALPLEAMCKVAWEFLERRIQEPSAPHQQRTLKAELVIRASSCR